MCSHSLFSPSGSFPTTWHHPVHVAAIAGQWELSIPCHIVRCLNPFTTKALFYVLNAIQHIKTGFSGERVKGSLTKGQEWTCPANTRCWPNVRLVLSHHLRRWSSMDTTMGQCLVFTGCRRFFWCWGCLCAYRWHTFVSIHWLYTIGWDSLVCTLWALWDAADFVFVMNNVLWCDGAVNTALSYKSVLIMYY